MNPSIPQPESGVNPNAQPLLQRLKPVLDAIQNSAKNLTGNPDLTFTREQPVQQPKQQDTTPQVSQQPNQTNPFMSRLQPVLDAITSPFSKELTYTRDATIDTPTLAQAFVSQESGGDYGAISTSTDSKGNHAYGKYQILGTNIPAWTKEVLGKSMTPAQFLKDQKAQDAIFQWHLNNLIKRYGNIEDVASAYFSGGPYAQNRNHKDKSGKTVAEYVSDIKKKYQQLANKNQLASATMSI